MAVKALEEAREMWQIKHNPGPYSKILNEVKTAQASNQKQGGKVNIV